MLTAPQGRLCRTLNQPWLLREYGPSLPNIKALYFDPYDECENARSDIHGIAYIVRPLNSAGNRGKSQLYRPVAYGEQGDDFTCCTLYSIVAWDHVSWPGNDFFAGSRTTDDLAPRTMGSRLPRRIR